MATTLALPRFMVLYSTSAGKYVNYLDDSDNSVAVRSNQVRNPRSKFEVEPSKLHPTMVHIRCSYNNKYLRRLTSSTWYISALANNPEDDQRAWSSTLFQPEFAGSDLETVRLLHVSTGRYAQWANAESLYMWVDDTSPLETKAQFQVIDWELLVTLPKHLAFRGDNQAYLGLESSTGGATLLRFLSYDLGDKSIANEVVAQPDGTYRIKNTSLGAFWRLDATANGYISADDLTTVDPTLNSQFEAVKVNDNTVALRNLENNMFCRRYTNQQVKDGLNGNETDITEFVHLVLTELVSARRIKDIKLHLDKGRVYDETPNPIVLNTGEPARNETDDVQTIDLDIPYLNKTSSTWTATNSSFKLGPVVEIQPDEIPYVTDSSDIGTTTPFAPSYVWGETTQGSPKQVKVHRVTLQPWTMVTIKMSATLASCSVPLTYTRYDTTDNTSGEEDAYIMDDGLYTGTNYFNFGFEASAPLPITKK